MIKIIQIHNQMKIILSMKNGISIKITKRLHLINKFNIIEMDYATFYKLIRTWIKMKQSALLTIFFQIIISTRSKYLKIKKFFKKK